MSTEAIFTKFYRSSKWGGEDSVSGTGSDLPQTREIIKELPLLFQKYKVQTVLDVACGDFRWMSMVNLDKVEYIGVDVVKELIQTNKGYERENVHFQELNLIVAQLPAVDLILCRDCLVHFSFADIFLALQNICSSQSQYLLSTTFTTRKENHNIVTGQWRPLNLEIAPFHFPKPLRSIAEGCTEQNGKYTDKSLGLWRVEDINELLAHG